MFKPYKRRARGHIAKTDYLTPCETDDVEASLAEIEAGKAKKFKSVTAFLRELKE